MELILKEQQKNISRRLCWQETPLLTATEQSSVSGYFCQLTSTDVKRRHFSEWTDFIKCCLLRGLFWKFFKEEIPYCLKIIIIMVMNSSQLECKLLGRQVLQFVWSFEEMPSLRIKTHSNCFKNWKLYMEKITTWTNRTWHLISFIKYWNYTD